MLWVYLLKKTKSLAVQKVLFF